MNTLPPAFRDLPQDRPLPVETWDPPFCGEMDLRIAQNGTWFHEGRPILRPAMVRLFSRLLRREGDAYRLVTPVEKLGIIVEDVPFIAVDMVADDTGLTFRTNVDDVVTAGPSHPLRFDTGDGGFRPYVRVRDGLEARLSRALAQEIVSLGQIVGDQFAIVSGGGVFPIMPAAAIS